MSGEIEDEGRFASDGRFALSDVSVMRSRDERSSDHWWELIARRIIAHLKLANWIVKRGPPLEDWPGKKRES